MTIPGVVIAVFFLARMALTLPEPAQGPAACFEEPGVEELTAFGPLRDKAFSWDRFLLSTLVRREAGNQLEGYRREQGIPLRFMLGQEESSSLPSNDRQKLQQSGLAGVLEPHPCGWSVQAFVKDLQGTHLPEWLEPDWVLEFNKRGRVIGRWDVPLDSPVRAVQGEEVWTTWDPQPLCSSQSLDLRIYLVVRSDGSLRLVSRPGLISERRKIKCPKDSEIPESDFLVCESMRDLKTLKTRRIAYQLPCQ